MNGVIGAGVILSVMGGGVFYNVLAAPPAWPTPSRPPLPALNAFGATVAGLDGALVHGVCGWVCAGVEWLVPKSPVAFHSLGLLPVCSAFKCFAGSLLSESYPTRSCTLWATVSIG